MPQTMVLTVYVLYVGTEPQESIMEHQAVMGARASSDAAYARVTYIPAGSVGNALLTRTKGINVDIVD